MKLIISTPDHFCSNCQQLSLCLYNSRMGVSHSAPVHSSLSLSVSELRVCLAPGRGSLCHVPGARDVPAPVPAVRASLRCVRARPGSGETFMGRKPGPETAAWTAAWSARTRHGTPVTELRAAGQSSRYWAPEPAAGAAVTAGHILQSSCQLSHTVCISCGWMTPRGSWIRNQKCRGQRKKALSYKV